MVEIVCHAALALDAAGYDPVIIETVGAGQSEIEIAKLAHTTIVVEAPGLGDDIQAAKAGLLEIADILVVNKSDKPESIAAANVLSAMLAMARETQENDHDWEVPLLQTSALEGSCISDLAGAIQTHNQFLKESGDWRDKEERRAQNQLERMIKDHLFANWQSMLDHETFQNIRMMVTAREISPRQALEKLFD